jgi:hypothetical protein
MISIENTMSNRLKEAIAGN